MASDSFFLKEDSHFMTRFGLSIDNICAFVCQNFEGNTKMMESLAFLHENGRRHFVKKMAAASAAAVQCSAARGIFIFPQH